jgi:hypothetical protein
MKRFHVHVAVADLNSSIAFYSAMFGAEPAVVKPDYAKWMLEDPRINFAISDRGQKPGINHLGLQAEDDTELEAIHANLEKASTAVVAEKDAHCCYARSDKYWVTDPQGIPWESFRSLGSIPLFGEAAVADLSGQSTTSCGSGAAAASCCPAPIEVKTKATSCCS